jgi:hypothetical protein
MSCLSWIEEGVLPLRKRRGRMRKERKHYTAEEQVAILRRDPLDKVPVSDLQPLNRRPSAN